MLPLDRRPRRLGRLNIKPQPARFAAPVRALVIGTFFERLGRWLLMAHDRSEGDKLCMTHEFLALMLGIRRSGVTVALGNLERRATINMRRGSITVLDRAGLEAAANGLYGVPETELRRLFGQPFAYEHRTNGSTSAIGVAAEHQGPRD